MGEAGDEQKDQDQGQDWQRVDARILGQLLAAQNFLFVLPDEVRIAEFFSEALGEVPGVASCFVCLGNPSVIVGPAGEICRKCMTLRKELGSITTLPPNFFCELATGQDLRVIPLGTIEHTFGFFILRTDSGGIFEPYWPFLNNLANYVALSLENRLQKRLLEKTNEELEVRVENRTEELTTMNILLEEEIQERKLAEETLLKEKDRAQSYLDIAGVMLVGLNDVGQIVLINKKGHEILGYREGDMVGLDWFATCLPPETREAARSDYLRLMSGQVSQLKQYENTVLTKDGEERVIDWRNAVLRDEHGKIIGIFSSGADITERKQAEEYLRQMNERFSLSTRAAHLGVWDWDIQKNELIWDDRMYELYGVKRKDFAGAYDAWLKGIHPDDRAFSDEISKQAQRGEREYDTEFRVVWPDNSIHYLKAYGQFVRDANGNPLRMTGINYDITERKQMEQALAARERKFRTLAENSPDNIARYDTNCRTIYVNPTVQKTLGAPADEMLGTTPIEVALIDDAGKYQEKIAEVLETGREAEMDLVLPGKEGEVRYHNIRFVAERDADGEITGVQTIGRDVTERKQAEKEIQRMNRELEQRVLERTVQLETANKELEAFAYSVSHDLRAPLRHIGGFLELLQKRTAGLLDEQSRHYMDTISASTKRMGQLIDDLLSFSRMGRNELSRKSVDLGDLVQKIIQELAPETQERIIHWRITDLPAVTGDRAMLRLALVNLISNALKFTHGCSQAEIEIGCLPGRETETIIFVRDNGVGFDMAYADRLFGVFQRLHRADEFEGTGIGLANVRRIITRHGGRVWAEGEVGRGATFYFSLPQIMQGT